MIKAFDISHHNNAEEMKKLFSMVVDAPAFLYIKRSEGLGLIQNGYFDDLAKSAVDNGIIVGGYHYINPTASSPKDFANLVFSRDSKILDCADTEASRLLTIANHRQNRLVPMMDVEEKYLIADVNACKCYLDLVCNSYYKQGGKRLGIYASHSLLSNARMLDLIKTYNLVIWDARYKYKCAKLHVDDSINDIYQLLQPEVGDLNVTINQFCTVYVDDNNEAHNLDCDIVYRPLDLLL